ncbi:MAG: hypothetical protein ACLPKE_11330 [Streptosporangiaceae bacterium]
MADFCRLDLGHGQIVTSRDPLTAATARLAGVQLVPTDQDSG